MKTITINKPDNEGEIILFRSWADYASWLLYGFSGPGSCDYTHVSIVARHGEKYTVDAIVAHSLSNEVHTVKTHGKSRLYFSYNSLYTFEYTTWVIPEPYFNLT